MSDSTRPPTPCATIDASRSLLAYVTMPDVDGAVALARELVERRLAAGVNVLPGALSVYRWEGEVRQAGECLLLAQVDASAFAGFRDFVTGSHPYQVPCVVALPIVDGHAPFLAWIGENSIPVPR